VAELEIGAMLRKLESELADTEGLKRRVSVNLAEETVDLIKQEFVDQKNPYGDPWAPKKAKDGRNTLSGPTGRLKGGWKPVRVDQDGYEISPSVNYAIFHQDPQPRKRKNQEFVGPMRLNQERREMVPDERGVPRAWSDAFEETALEVIAAHFGS
jgi:hypothetical protein